MFKGKVIVITGSTQGIGKRTAELLVKQGARVVINSRCEKKVEQTVSELTLSGHQAIGFAGNVSDFSFCERLATETVKIFGKIDYLINNAGLAAKGVLENTTPEVIESVVNTNILGSIYPTRAILPYIKEQNGGVLFISSLAGIVGLPNCLSYSFTKRSLISIAESLKVELYDQDVFVGVNFPGFTENHDQKKYYLPNGELVPIKDRKEVKVQPIDKTAKQIILQLKTRRFLGFTSLEGRLIYNFYRLFPTASIAIVKRKRRKIMNM